MAELPFGQTHMARVQFQRAFEAPAYGQDPASPDYGAQGTVGPQTLPFRERLRQHRLFQAVKPAAPWMVFLGVVLLLLAE
jgi:hypothetical protein